MFSKSFENIKPHIMFINFIQFIHYSVAMIITRSLMYREKNIVDILSNALGIMFIFDIDDYVYSAISSFNILPLESFDQEIILDRSNKLLQDNLKKQDSKLCECFGLEKCCFTKINKYDI